MTIDKIVILEVKVFFQRRLRKRKRARSGLTFRREAIRLDVIRVVSNAGAADREIRIRRGLGFRALRVVLLTTWIAIPELESGKGAWKLLR